MKFWALVIMSDLTLKRMWMDESIAILLLSSNKNMKIYNAAHSQEAVLSKNKLLWKSVEEVEKFG